MKIYAYIVKNVLINLPHNDCAFFRQSLVIFLFLWCIGSLLSYPPSLSAQSSSVSDSPSEKYMMQGLNAFQRGAFEQAILDWREAVKLYEKEGKSNKQRETLV